MRLNEFFNDVFSYAFSAEDWVEKYFESVGYTCKYTFVSDLCIADWYGNKEEVIDTYNRIVNEWGGGYKEFTEIVMSVNMLSWFNNQLMKQGIEDRGEWIGFYTDLYHKAREAFYEKYGDDDEACDWFFECTD